MTAIEHYAPPLRGHCFYASFAIANPCPPPTATAVTGVNVFVIVGSRAKSVGGALASTRVRGGWLVIRRIPVILLNF